MALTFTDLIKLEGLDPGEVRLVRHQDEGPERQTPWTLWLRQDGSFETYQRIQRRDVFDACRYLASFAVLPDQRTVFLGLYELRGKAVAPAGLCCPLTGRDVSGFNLYDLEPLPVLAGFAERVLIDWGEGFRAWVQRADNQPKPILEIRAAKCDPPFPGFFRFETTLSALPTLPLSWQAVLKATRGVYLLRSKATGEHYVGSVLGQDGFLGRWQTYAANGHGGNVLMRTHEAGDYVIAILESAASSANDEDILGCEQHWKRKLGSRAHGLNGN